MRGTERTQSRIELSRNYTLFGLMRGTELVTASMSFITLLYSIWLNERYRAFFSKIVSSLNYTLFGLMRGTEQRVRR